MRTIALKHKDRLPEYSGIYWGIGDGRVVYVGMAKNLNSRWNGSEPHHRYAQLARCKNPKLKYRHVPVRRLRYEEAKDIQRFQPRLNKQFPDPKDHYFFWPFFEDFCLFAIGVLFLTYILQNV